MFNKTLGYEMVQHQIIQKKYVIVSNLAKME